jgi:hypothetical protein
VQSPLSARYPELKIRPSVRIDRFWRAIDAEQLTAYARGLGLKIPVLRETILASDRRLKFGNVLWN